MSGKPAPARVKKWRGKHYLFYTDFTTGKQHRKTCTGLKAFNAEQRKDLERQYRAKERQQAAEVTVKGGRVTGDATLSGDITAYLDDCKRRVAIRVTNPDVRAGLSAKSLANITETITHFTDWLETNKLAEMKSKDLSAELLTLYLDFVISEDTRLGNRRKKRSAATVNLYLRNLKACLRWIQRLTPRRFHEYEAVALPLKPVQGRQKQAVAYSSDELVAFLDTALKREDPSRTITIKHRRGTRKRRIFEQAPGAKADTPVSRLFLLLALTGCRLGEALALTWDDVDLERGRLTIRAEKTGLTRWIPLKGAAEGEVAPKFAELLERWWEEHCNALAESDQPETNKEPKPEYVLPHLQFDAPTFSKSAWQAINKSAEVQRIGPQKLRQNFTSYAASLGIPAAVAAMWQGHSADVAERHYRAQVLDRNKGATTFEEAMGLAEIIESMLKNH